MVYHASKPKNHVVYCLNICTATLLKSKGNHPYPRIALKGQPISAPAAVAKTATLKEINIHSVINKDT